MNDNVAFFLLLYRSPFCRFSASGNFSFFAPLHNTLVSFIFVILFSFYFIEHYVFKSFLILAGFVYVQHSQKSKIWLEGEKKMNSSKRGRNMVYFLCFLLIPFYINQKPLYEIIGGHVLKNYFDSYIIDMSIIQLFPILFYCINDVEVTKRYTAKY